MAQNGSTVVGSVVDENGEPVIGATVMLKGHKGVATATDLDGHFKLEVPSKGGTLVFSYIGMLNKEARVSGKPMQVVMQENARQLNDVVVVGYGQQKKASVVGAITQTDEMELSLLGEEKRAIFAVIPDNDSSFNFIIGMLYTQLFQQLYYQADIVHGGRLPVHVHFLMDEFANISIPEDFDKLLSTMRSREISVSIILQNMAQLKALYEKQWENITGNCDSFLYLGGNEQSTHEYVSKLLGKETIDLNTYGQSKGRSGSYSTNWQLSGRELMTPDEVRMLDNRYALLFIRGERPVMDLKYDLLRHPNIGFTADGGAEPYRHGEQTAIITDVTIENMDPGDDAVLEAGKHDYQAFTEEELEAFFIQKTEEKKHEEQGK